MWGSRGPHLTVRLGGSSLMPGQEVRSAGSGETLEDLETSPISQAGGQLQTA